MKKYFLFEFLLLILYLNQSQCQFFLEDIYEPVFNVKPNSFGYPGQILIRSTIDLSFLQNDNTNIRVIYYSKLKNSNDENGDRRKIVYQLINDQKQVFVGIDAILRGWPQYSISINNQKISPVIEELIQDFIEGQVNPKFYNYFKDIKSNIIQDPEYQTKYNTQPIKKQEIPEQNILNQNSYQNLINLLKNNLNQQQQTQKQQIKQPKVQIQKNSQQNDQIQKQVQKMFQQFQKQPIEKKQQKPKIPIQNVNKNQQDTQSNSDYHYSMFDSFGRLKPEFNNNNSQPQSKIQNNQNSSQKQQYNASMFDSSGKLISNPQQQRQQQQKPQQLRTQQQRPQQQRTQQQRTQQKQFQQPKRSQDPTNFHQERVLTVEERFGLKKKNKNPSLKQEALKDIKSLVNNGQVSREELLKFLQNKQILSIYIYNVKKLKTFFSKKNIDVKQNKQIKHQFLHLILF